MTQREAIALVRGWTDDELSCTSFKTEKEAAKCGEAYSLILDCKYQVISGDGAFRAKLSY